MPGEPSPKAAPTRIGKYRILGPLSEGGMGRVYRAAMSGPGGFERAVALKVIRPDVLEDDGHPFTAMFEREAEILGMLSHAGIVTLLDFGIDGKELYLCLEWIRGKDLKAWFKEARKARGGPLPIAISVRIVEQVAEALDYAHRLRVRGVNQNLVHRDVTPSNILISFDGAVKLTDFGIAKIKQKPLTEAGVWKGKVAYMSPEQILCRGLDGRSDIFSLGVVLWELLAHQFLFVERGDKTQVAEAVRTLPIKPPSSFVAEVPAELDDIVMTAIERDAARRYATAGEFAKALAEFAGRHGMTASSYDVARALRAAFPLEVPSVGIDVRGTTGVVALDGLRAPAAAEAPDASAGRSSQPETAPARPHLLPPAPAFAPRSGETTVRTLAPAGGVLEDTSVPRVTEVTTSPGGPGWAVDRRWRGAAVAGVVAIAVLTGALVRFRGTAPAAGGLPAAAPTPTTEPAPHDTVPAGPEARVAAAPPAPPQVPSAPSPSVPSPAPARPSHPPKHRRSAVPAGPSGVFDVINVIPVVDVTVDGHEVGWSPHLGFPLPPGRHRIILKTEDGPRRSFTVHMPPAGHLLFRGPFPTVKPQLVK